MVPSRLIYCLVGLACLAPCACRQGPAEGRPCTAQRIVSLAPNITEIIAALGQAERLVAITGHCNWPQQIIDRPKIGTFWQPNLEAIIAARPDLVIGLQMPSHGLVADGLQRMGYRCLLVRLERFEDLYDAIDRIAEAIGCSQQGRWLCGHLARIQAGQLAVGGPRPRVLFVLQRQPLRVAGPETFIDQAIYMAGGINAIGPSPFRYPPIGIEELLASRPDLIIEPAAVVQPTRSADDPFWARFSQIPAVARGRIYKINEDLISRLGPRISDGIDQIAQCLHGL